MVCSCRSITYVIWPVLVCMRYRILQLYPIATPPSYRHTTSLGIYVRRSRDREITKIRSLSARPTHGTDSDDAIMYMRGRYRDVWIYHACDKCYYY